MSGKHPETTLPLQDAEPTSVRTHSGALYYPRQIKSHIAQSQGSR